MSALICGWPQCAVLPRVLQPINKQQVKFVHLSHADVTGLVALPASQTLNVAERCWSCHASLVPVP